MRLFWLLLLLALPGCVPPQPAATVNNFPNAPPINSVPIDTLPGWRTDNTAAALAAFVQSCKAIALMPPDHSLGGDGIAQQAGGQAGEWLNACNGARDVAPGDAAAAKQYFEAYFTAYAITGPARITGYFEPQYPGAKNPAPGFTIPLYARPADPELAYLPRAAIDHNALFHKAPVTAYLANPVDAFMLQLYGEGRILLPDGHTLRVGFDGQNCKTDPSTGAEDCQPYTPIGSLLLANGDLTPNNVTFQSIYAWLISHPDQAQTLMEENARYVFLKPLGGLPDDEGAPGTIGVPKTAGRSLAIDPAFIPLGMPVYLATTNPSTGAPLDRLTIAQDTDSGIHGAAEAKLFFGTGPQAEATAGSMQQSGQLFMLIPRPTPSS
jgi:membrane-bound lytic murein transglycosylase A